jgi:hypothetical protein
VQETLQKSQIPYGGLLSVANVFIKQGGKNRALNWGAPCTQCCMNEIASVRKMTTHDFVSY